jgi:hypothetical protein
MSGPEDAKAAAVRTRVRKHVMKDIGRSRRKPKKNVTVKLIVDPQCPLGSRDIDSFIRFPIEMGQTEKALISNSKLPSLAFWVVLIFLVLHVERIS